MDMTIFREGNWTLGPNGVALLGAIVGVAVVVAMVVAFVLMVLFRTVDCIGADGGDDGAAAADQLAALGMVDEVSRGDLPILGVALCSRPTPTAEVNDQVGARADPRRDVMPVGLALAYGGSRLRDRLAEVYGLVIWALELNRELEAASRKCQREVIAELLGRCARPRGRRLR